MISRLYPYLVSFFLYSLYLAVSA
uniref:Uncharacterized protein n=1 Tax=Arundo donax TaxID=35708 RepID=A0A0A9EBN4_ARUDO